MTLFFAMFTVKSAMFPVEHYLHAGTDRVPSLRYNQVALSNLWKFLLLLVTPCALALQGEVPPKFKLLIDQSCLVCHSKILAKGGLDLAALPFDLKDSGIRSRWIRIHDRVEKGEMPPKPAILSQARRAEPLKQLANAIQSAEQSDIAAHGRGPMRRLNREEFEQNLRDVLQLPHLDIRDMLPEDREEYHSNKTSERLDMSRVQLTAYLDAVESALRQAMVTSSAPPPITSYRAVGTKLFSSPSMTGGRESMFFAKDSKFVNISNETFNALRKSGEHDPAVEMVLSRSAGWPYSAYPQAFAAKFPGEYRIRFSAQAVLQQPGMSLKPAVRPQPMTFRSRKPSNQDTAEDIRNTGGIIDVQPGIKTYETTVLLREGQTIEYGLLGLPTPQPDVNNITGSYRFPPLPEGGAPGVAFQWLEIEGPLAPPMWPPLSHRVLFDDLGVSAESDHPREQASRLLRRFVNLASRNPVPQEAMAKFEQLIFARLDKKESFADAMLAGYKAFLCSGNFLYLQEPLRGDDHFAIASRLSHFLANTRPDASLLELARTKRLREPKVLRSETDRLIASAGFDRFVTTFTDYWLSLRYIRRDDPDIRLYPEYRLDEYLVESMAMETRAFFTAMIRENLPVSSIITADFVFANDRLAKHYGLEPITGSVVRKVALAKESPYGGLLTQGAILKVTANGTTTSPVLRGAWIMDRLLGQPPVPPPPGVPAVEPDIRGAKNIRELLALHTKSQSCAGCHAQFDPVGLALEDFDVLGASRTRYRGTTEGEHITGIDPAGHDFNYTTAGLVDSSGKLLDGRTFQNIRELKALLSSDSRVLARGLLQQFTVYSTGTPVRFGDRQEIESILDACAANGYGVRDLLHRLVQSKIFLGSNDSK